MKNTQNKPLVFILLAVALALYNCTPHQYAKSYSQTTLGSHPNEITLDDYNDFKGQYIEGHRKYKGLVVIDTISFTKKGKPILKYRPMEGFLISKSLVNEIFSVSGTDSILVEFGKNENSNIGLKNRPNTKILLRGLDKNGKFIGITIGTNTNYRAYDKVPTCPECVKPQ